MERQLTNLKENHSIKLNRKCVALLVSFAFIVTTFLIVPTPALADFNWVSTGGPYNCEHVNALVYDGVNNNMLYAGTSYTEGSEYVYRNPDPTGGGAWTQVGGSLGFKVHSLAYDSSTDILYAGVSGGRIYRNPAPSGGGAWALVGGAIGGNVRGLAYDSANDILYAGTSANNVHRNTDPSGAGVWANIGVLSGDVLSLAYDAANDNLYAGTKQWAASTVEVTTDPQGAPPTWTDTNLGNINDNYDYVRSLAYDSANDILYAGTGYSWGESTHAVFRNANPAGGGPWQNAGVPDGNNVHALFLDSANGVLYAGTGQGTAGGGLYMNRDPASGITWEDTGLHVGGVRSLAYDGASNTLYGATTAQEVWGAQLSLPPAPAPSYNWMSTGGPYDCGHVNALAYDGVNNNMLYAGTYSGDVYRNPDPSGGGAWAQVGATLPSNVRSLAYDGANDILYAGISGAVYINPNPSGAGVWAQVGAGIGDVRALAYDSANDILYAGANDVHRNTDPSGGGGWTNIGTLSSVVRSLAYDGANDNLYAGTWGPSVEVTTNPQGVPPTWTDTDLDDICDTQDVVRSLAYDGANDILYAGTGYNTGGESTHAVFRNSDPTGGGLWQNAGVPDGNNVFALFLDNANGVLYAGTGSGYFGGGLYINRNPASGITWEDTGLHVGGVRSLAYDGASNTLYGATTAQEVWGAQLSLPPAPAPSYNWMSTGGPYDCGHVNALAYDGVNNNMLYAGTYSGDVYRNPDPSGGGAWAQVGATLPSNVRSLAYDGANDILYAGISGAVYRNPNPSGGGVWAQVGLGIAGDVQALAYDSANDILYAGANDVHRNTGPGGVGGWTNIGALSGAVLSLAYDGANDNLYAGTDDPSVEVTTNPQAGAPAWTDTDLIDISDLADEVRSLAYDSANDILYAGTGSSWSESTHAVFRNTDPTGGGWAWQNAGVPDGNTVYALFFDNASGVLYAGTGSETAGGGLYTNRAPASGITWEDAGLHVGSVLSLAYDDSASLILYGGTDGQEAWGALVSCTVNATVGGGQGTVDPPTQSVLYRESAQIDITPNSGWNIDTITDNGSQVPVADPYVINNVTEDHDVVVMFEGGITPVIDSVSPSEGPPGSPVTIKGTNFGATQGNSYVTFNGVKATQYVSWTDTEIVVIVPEGATSGPVQVVTSAGGSNTDKDFTPEGKPLGSQAWIVAEGSTGEGFDTFILMQNPYNVPAPTAVAFATEEGIQDGTLLEIPPNSRVTMRLSDYMPDQWSISTLVAAEVPIVVERSMYWNSDETDYPYEMMSGHANLGLPAPMQPGFKMDAESDRSTDQYFPEGSTAGFDTWILLFNPMETAAQAKVTLMDETGPVVEEDVSIEPLSRKTVHLNKLLPNANEVATRVESDAFLVAERSMYWDPAASAMQPYEMIGGHSTSGSPDAANNWYVAEGSTGGGFETYILLQNTGDADAPVTALFSDATGTVAQLDMTMPAQSRSTVKVSDYVPDNFQVSTSVTSDAPIVTERSMYWDKRETAEPSSMKDGHSTVGEMGAAKTWMVPEGSTGGGFDTFVLLANTESTDATAAVTFMTEGGPQAPFNITIPANSRYTLRVSEYLPDSFQVSTLITSNRDLVVERSMYWDNRQMSPDGNFPVRPFECIGGHSANGLDP